jgi:hypothetical protein
LPPQTQTERMTAPDRRRRLLVRRAISPADLLQHPETLPLVLRIILVIFFWPKNAAFLSALNLSSMFAFIPSSG